MIFEEDSVRTKAGIKLDELGVEELRERIAALEAQIEACKTVMAKKMAERAAADALFSKKD